MLDMPEMIQQWKEVRRSPSSKVWRTLTRDCRKAMVADGRSGQNERGYDIAGRAGRRHTPERRIPCTCTILRMGCMAMGVTAVALWCKYRSSLSEFEASDWRSFDRFFAKHLRVRSLAVESEGTHDLKLKASPRQLRAGSPSRMRKGGAADRPSITEKFHMARWASKVEGNVV